jgi:ABC-type polysaccharide/polyol phosphate transport system ATPase subunit
METVPGALSNGVYTSESGLVYYVGDGKDHLLNIIATIATLVEGDVSFEKAVATIETEIKDL